VARKVRIGVIGAGSIGGELYRRLVGAADLGLEPAFIWTRDARRLPDDVRRAHRIADLDPGSLRAARPDLIVEAASPEITVRHGAAILALADYLPLSVTALADDPLHAALLAVAGHHRHRLLIPTGALVGASALAAVGDSWRRITFRMEKPPTSLAPVDGPLPAAAHRERTVVHDGSVRSVATRFPRNVNAMVAGALVTVGLDRARAVLVADPTRTDLMLGIDAIATDGARIRIRRRQPASGVSGTEMGASAWASVLAAIGRAPSGSIV